MEDAVAAVAEVLRLCPAKRLMATYKIPTFSNVDDFLQHVAFARGKLQKGGVGDALGAARVVLHDWQVWLSNLGFRPGVLQCLHQPGLELTNNQDAR